MRAKYVFEKFKEESDPIKDMGIGTIKYFYDNMKPGDIFRFKKSIPSFGSLYKKRIVKRDPNIIDIVNNYIDKYIKIDKVSYTFLKNFYCIG